MNQYNQLIYLARLGSLILGLILTSSIFAEDNLYWALEILEKNEILDPALELQICSGHALSTHQDDNISSTCVWASRKYMSSYKGRKYCDNVATNCFNISFPKIGFYKGRDKCLNVSSGCFKENIKNSNLNIAANNCSNVSNICYNHKRSEGLSIKASIKRCKDVNW